MMPRGSIGARFYLALFVLFVVGSLGFGLVVARRAGTSFAENSHEAVMEGRRDLEKLLAESSAEQADLMDRAVGHLADNIGGELQDVPFDVFEGRDELLVAYLRERLDEARKRNRENSRVIASLFRTEQQERIGASLAVLDESQSAVSRQGADDVFRDMLAWGGAYLLGVAVIVGLLFHRLVMVPLQDATGVIETIRGGDLSRRIDARGSDEIARLARSFNSMAAELEAHQRNLEDLVAEKTSALSQALADQQQKGDELRLTVEQLEATQQQLVESAKLAAIGTMSRGMAHEFNNIMGGISGCAEELLEDERDSESRKLLEVIVRTSRRALVITENLLSFSRGSGGEPAPTSLAEVLRSSTALVEPEAARREVSLEVRAPELGTIVTDGRGVQQVVLNLAINAVQACRPGGTVVVALEESEGEQLIIVTDDGSGIDPAIRDRIFDPFFSTKDPETGRGGTGLGLSVSLGIVTALGGVLTAESPGAGSGSRFVVALPRRAPDHG